MKFWPLIAAVCLQLLPVIAFKSCAMDFAGTQLHERGSISIQDRAVAFKECVQTRATVRHHTLALMTSNGNMIKDEKVVVKLRFRSLKGAALRSFLKFWMIGQDGWQFGEDLSTGALILLHRQSQLNQCGISMRLDDTSGDANLCIVRVGDATLGYVLQESLLLHRLLDILEELHQDPEIPDDRRLFSMLDTTDLSNARRQLPARQGKSA